MATPPHRLPAAVACAAALVVPLVVAGPAAADVEVRRDPRGDVSEIQGRQQEPRPSAGVLQLTSRHADGRVSMQVVVADLDTTSAVGANFAVGTSDERLLVAVVQRTADGEKVVGLYDTDLGQEVDCPGLQGNLLPAADRVTASVPRSCLGRPRWVRTGAAAFAVYEEFVLSYADDALRDSRTRSPVPFVGTRRLLLD
ncbi:hypothetical protein [Nocardioides sp. CFH 31398]|uniref:hypothetical protein n=1 Tax=Nocardioides sp. CFH 31398 TaxID=2919579 RepID=UPI001F0600BA|nr:hypothetical protein [Nocardioides sp. CFH 31398]MCH1867962.1 hypothetical protein [Nocardioides sp. CFH 31398]